MPSLDTFRHWFDRGVAKGATHMIVVSDMFDYESYPIYVMPGTDVREVAAPYDQGHKDYAGNMQKLMEVYNLRLSREMQMREARAFHY